MRSMLVHEVLTLLALKYSTSGTKISLRPQVEGEGIFVQTLEEGGNAQLAGVRVGDRIQVLHAALRY